MNLKALLLTRGVIVATFLSSFVAGRQLAPEPSGSPTSASLTSSSLCSRSLATTLWGGAFAFFSVMADAWPASQAAASLNGNNSLLERLYSCLKFGTVHPLDGLGLIFRQMSTTLRFRQILSSINPELAPDTMSISTKLGRVKHVILATFFGTNQSRCFLKGTRMAANTRIVLGISDSKLLPPTHFDTDKSFLNEYSLVDALTLGHKTADNSWLMELNRAGKLALLESSILPNYRQLHLLDGRSGIATLIICVQATGYSTSIIYRAVHHLPVSPIEAIGFAFSMLVVFRSVFHSMGVIVENPLVIFLNPAQQEEMSHKCWSTRWLISDDTIVETAAMVAMVFMGSGVVAFTIFVEWHVLRISWLDAMGPILFSLSLITQLFFNIIVMKTSYRSTWTTLLFWGCIMICFGGILVSIVATVLNWKTNKFDARTPWKIFPFIG